jgi:orotidine-5'-phosphate decarboxylase
MTAPALPVQKLEARMEVSDSLLCVGLDPDLARLPHRFRAQGHPQFAFCQEVIDAAAPFACAFKPNTAFFEAAGPKGWDELRAVCSYVRENYPDVFLICDAKRGDIGSTNGGYVQAIFDQLGADAVTVQPYLGAEALEPFLARSDKASIVLCRTSNPGAGEFQDLHVDGKPLWCHVAERVSTSWNGKGNCMLVVGATWPAEMAQLRSVAGDMTFLVPGIGAQGGDVEAVLRAGLRADGKGLILSSSREILYAESPAKAAEATRDTIRRARERLHARS